MPDAGHVAAHLGGGGIFLLVLPARDRRALRTRRNLKMALPFALSGVVFNQAVSPSRSLRHWPARTALLGMAVVLAGSVFVAMSAPVGARRATLVGDALIVAGAHWNRCPPLSKSSSTTPAGSRR